MALFVLRLQLSSVTADPALSCGLECDTGTCLIVNGTDTCICDKGYGINIITDTCKGKSFTCHCSYYVCLL